MYESWNIVVTVTVFCMMRVKSSQSQSQIQVKTKDWQRRKKRRRKRRKRQRRLLLVCTISVSQCFNVSIFNPILFYSIQSLYMGKRESKYKEREREREGEKMIESDGATLWVDSLFDFGLELVLDVSHFSSLFN